jgi:ubiquinone/menaquinone biosynthesis C-methylase UbiE
MNCEDETNMCDSVFKQRGETVNGIITFIRKDELQGDNQKFAALYDRIAPLYNISQKIFYKMKFDGERRFRNDFLQYINIKQNDTVLETSVGTADNFRYTNKNADYYGVDISYGMLRKAVQHCKKWHINATFACCEAENLPFKDSVFDVVYSCGGFNFYNDKMRALTEMIRVAKSGTKIFIIDETEKTVREIYKNVPGKELYDASKTNAPIDLIPEHMKNVDVEIICKGYMYILSFEKP